MNKKLFSFVFLLLSCYLVFKINKNFYKFSGTIRTILSKYKVRNLTNRDFLNNPFLIQFPEQKEINNKEYEQIQHKLQKVDIFHKLRKLYLNHPTTNLSFQSFERRCNTGRNQQLINIERNQLPIKNLEKIGNGGEWCIVSSAPYDNIRNIFLEGLLKQLHNTNFNGYFYYRIGGYPNPTGKEIQYAGVPYAIKIFMMLEAKKLGFNKVLWIDSAMWPIQNIDLFFHHINEYGAVFHLYDKTVRSGDVFLETRQLLKKFTGKDPCKSPHVWGAIFGLDFSKKHVKLFLKRYLKLVKLGTPFFAHCPEEAVFSCLLNTPSFKEAKKNFNLKIPFVCLEEVEPNIERCKKHGYHFLLKTH